ncbi:heme oxygenase 2 [Artemisia annua]|uniref:Heme oxygenase 2 n=1 Tax=Artemisia annua TaxID=35608 RepID=A0A2U1KZZ2_ARTAN|nr:heme oxygenase 2 [Artemisia annua]
MYTDVMNVIMQIYSVEDNVYLDDDLRDKVKECENLKIELKIKVHLESGGDVSLPPPVKKKRKAYRLAYFRNTGLERSESFTKDIEFISQQLTIPEPLFTSKKYVKYLEDLAAESPPLFFSHLYNIYFSHITGGQVIARKVCSTNIYLFPKYIGGGKMGSSSGRVSEKLLNGRELAICQWPGDPEVLLKNMREKLNALGQHMASNQNVVTGCNNLLSSI